MCDLYFGPETANRKQPETGMSGAYTETMEMWLQYAAERATALGLDFGTLSEAHAIVCAAVGKPWLDDQERTPAKTSMPITTAHPLFRHLQSSSDESLLEICELALYFRAFQKDSALRSIAHDVTTNKYAPVLSELAFAFRWKDAGANVALRTATPHGEADFEATIEGVPFTIEVSSFPHDALTSEPFRIAGVVTDTMASTLGEQNPPAAVRVTIERRAAGNHESAIRAAVRDCCGAWRNAPDRTISRETEFGRVEVSALTEADGAPSINDQGQPTFHAAEEWDLVLQATEKQVPRDEPLYKMVPREGYEYGRVYLRLPEDERDIYGRIATKLKKELRQLRGVSTPRIVILDVSSPEFGNVFELDRGPLISAIRNILRGTPELAAVFLSTRRWTTAHRHKYYSAFIDNTFSVYRLPHPFMYRLTQREWTWDFVADREYPDAVKFTSGVVNPFKDFQPQ